MGIDKNLKNLMEEAKKIQQRMQEAQEQLKKLKVTGESGGGLVTVQMNGRYETLKVKVNPSLLEEDLEMLEDLLASANNAAARKVEEESKKEVSKLTAGLNIPTDFMKEDEREE